VKIRFTPSARVQFLEGLEYIRQDSPLAAANFREKAEEFLRRLEEFPESGRSIPEFPGLPHREVIVRPYRFFYRVVGKTVWIVAVWHGAQLPEGPQH
jgi:plasmid stabilization system protein ParE